MLVTPPGTPSGRGNLGAPPGRGDPSVARGFLWNAGSTAIPIVTAFIVSFLVARWLGPEILGIVSLTMALATTYLIPAKFGIDTALSKLLAEHAATGPARLPALLRSGILLRFLFTLPVSLLAYWAAVPLAAFYDDPSLVPAFRAGALLVFAVSFYELFNLAMVGLGLFPRLFGARLVMFTARVLWVGGVLFLGAGAAAILIGYSASTLIPAAVFGLTLLLKYRVVPESSADTSSGIGADPAAASSGSKGTVSTSPLREVLTLAAPLAISTAAVTIYGQMDRLMLGYFWDAEEVGQYSLARNVMETSLFPVHALTLTLLPVLSGAFARGNLARCRELVRHYLTFGLLFAGAVILILYFLSGPLVEGVYGEVYAYGAGLLPAFTVVLLLRVLTGVLLPMLLAADRAKTYAALTILSAAVNFFANLAFIPGMRSAGAIWATALSYVPVLAIGGLVLARSIRLRLEPGDLFRYLRVIVAALLTGLLAVLLLRPGAGLAVAVAEALVLLTCYGVMAFAVRAVGKREVDQLRSSLRTRSPAGTSDADPES